MPETPVVVADQQVHRRCCASRTARSDSILRIKNIQMSVPVRRHRRLPLIADPISKTELRRETRDRESRRGSHDQQPQRGLLRNARHEIESDGPHAKGGTSATLTGLYPDSPRPSIANPRIHRSFTNL